MRFDPAGITDDPDIRMASSVMDYIFRRLALDHLSYDQRSDLGILSVAERSAALSGADQAAPADEVDPDELAQSVPPVGQPNQESHRPERDATGELVPPRTAQPSSSRLSRGAMPTRRCA